MHVCLCVYACAHVGVFLCVLCVYACLVGVFVFCLHVRGVPWKKERVQVGRAAVGDRVNVDGGGCR